MPKASAEAQRAYQREWARKRREDWIASQGGVCARCGSDDRLEVDHINPQTKLMHPRAIWNRRAEVRIAELAKCQVLCYSCHKAKTRSEQFLGRHGHNFYVRHKCRCDICRAGHSEYNRQWRARRSAA